MTDAPDPSTRKVVADHLYLDRGPKEASSRCDDNTQFAAVDLCSEMLKHLRLQPGQNMVDIGCGTGQHLERYAEAVGPDGSARGFDFSEKAVEQARARGITADAADGANLPLGDQSVDALSSSFSMYYLPDREKTLTEWHRVVRPGGRVAISGPANGTNVELYAFHEDVVGVGPSDSDLMALGYVEDLPETMKSIGFVDVVVETFDNPITFPEPEKFITYWSNASLFARTVDDDKRDEMLAKGLKLLQDRGGPYVVTKRVAIAIGVRG
jgi:SAM-dependent methyltransferase